MPAAEYNFSIEKGTSFVIAFEYKDDNQIPINMTNWCARIRWIEDQESPVIRTFSTNTRNSDYELTIDPLLGKVILKLSASFTSSLNFGTARYDFELQEPNDLYSNGGKKIFRILQGAISLLSRNVPGDDAFDCDTYVQNDCGTC
jgi:hypothetical protein